MKSNELTITEDQKSEISNHLEEIITKNLTLKALFDSIHMIVENEINSALNKHKGQPILGIPYLMQLAEITGNDLAGLTDKIFKVMHNDKSE